MLPRVSGQNPALACASLPSVVASAPPEAPTMLWDMRGLEILQCKKLWAAAYNAQQDSQHHYLRNASRPAMQKLQVCTRGFSSKISQLGGAYQLQPKP